MSPILVLEATFIREVQIVYRNELEDRGKEVSECTITDYRAALAPKKWDRPEEARRRASLLAEWERIFEVRGEFDIFDEGIEDAIFGDRPCVTLEHVDPNGIMRRVIVERDETTPDRCSVQFYRGRSPETIGSAEADQITRVTTAVFLERRILKSDTHFRRYVLPLILAEPAAKCGSDGGELAAILAEVDEL